MCGDYQISMHIKTYLFKKYKKSTKCGWSEINLFTKTIPLEIEHIGGNYKNNHEENLFLLYPNCHSLISTNKGAHLYKSRKTKQQHNCNKFL